MLCGARGQTVQMADLMGNTGAIIALDINGQRLTALSNHLERCHVRSAAVYKLDARKASGLNLQFDRILLDVPCSGNFASDPQWFNRRTIQDVKRNANPTRNPHRSRKCQRLTVKSFSYLLAGA